MGDVRAVYNDITVFLSSNQFDRPAETLRISRTGAVIISHVQMDNCRSCLPASIGILCNLLRCDRKIFIKLFGCCAAGQRGSYDNFCLLYTSPGLLYAAAGRNYCKRRSSGRIADRQDPKVRCRGISGFLSLRRHDPGKYRSVRAR